MTEAQCLELTLSIKSTPVFPEVFCVLGRREWLENELEHFKDNKRISIITDRDTSLKPRRTFIEFYEDQINKQEKHKNHLMENEKKHNNKISSNVLSKPVLNEETIKTKVKSKII